MIRRTQIIIIYRFEEIASVGNSRITKSSTLNTQHTDIMQTATPFETSTKIFRQIWPQCRWGKIKQTIWVWWNEIRSLMCIFDAINSYTQWKMVEMMNSIMNASSTNFMVGSIIDVLLAFIWIFHVFFLISSNSVFIIEFETLVDCWKNNN